MNEGDVVFELNLWNIREGVRDPRGRFSRQTSGIASTETSSQCGHDRLRERTRLYFRSLPRLGRLKRTRITQCSAAYSSNDGRRSKASPTFQILSPRSFGPSRFLVHPQTFPRPCPYSPSSPHFPWILNPRLRRYPISRSRSGPKIRSGKPKRKRFAEDIFHPDVRLPSSIHFLSS